MADGPPWAELNPDLWRKIFSYTSNWVAWLPFGTWKGRCRPIFHGAAVCTALRRALLGPDAAQLWEHVHFSSADPSWLKALTIRQARYACSATIWGGGWQLAELQAAVNSLTSLSCMLTLFELLSADEAAVIGQALSRQPSLYLTYRGDQPCILPPTLNGLSLDVHATGGYSAGTEAVTQRLLACLAPLSALEELVLRAPKWTLKTADVADLVQRHPRLNKLELDVMAYSCMQPHAVGALSMLAPSAGISLEFDLDDSNDGCLGELLRQLRRVPLHSLTLSACDISSVNEELLAQCSIADTLRVRTRDPEKRFELVPAGCRVLYDPLNDYDDDE